MILTKRGMTSAIVLFLILGTMSGRCQSGERRRMRVAQRRAARRDYFLSEPDITGPVAYMEIGTWAPVGGPWEALLKASTNFGIGYGECIAEWEGDTLPDSWTMLNFGYRYAHLKGDRDVQLMSATFQGEVEKLDLHLLEARVIQRFDSPVPLVTYLEVGAGMNIGGADGEIVPAVFTPGERQVRITDVQEDALFLRGELIFGAGYQFRALDVGVRTTLGLGGSRALLGYWRGESDVGVTLNGTIYLDEFYRRARIWFPE